jgi:uncharacterized membrane protein YcaP (DUF421 family)
MENILKVVLYASMAYLSLFFIAKLLGKKEIAQLNFIDYVTGISIGSIAAEMATELETPFYLYLISMSMFFLLDFIVTFLGRKTNFFKIFLRGTPIVLIDNGKVDFKALKKSKLDFFDLLGLARDKGYFDISEISYAIFETNGDLSILATDPKRQVKKEDFPEIESSEPSLTYYVVVDGEISKFALQEIQKDKAWVKSEAKKQKTKIKDIFFAVYDEENDKLEITTKE